MWAIAVFVMIATDADLVNRAMLSMQAMNVPNTHHFPNLLAGGAAIPVSVAPSLPTPS